MNSRIKLARLMKMSWSIQKNRHITRSKSLQAAWAILINEDITVHYLTQRFSGRRTVAQKNLNQLSIFNH